MKKSDESVVALDMTDRLQTLRDLPADAPIWIFGASRALKAEEVVRIEDALSHFVSTWASHNNPLRGSGLVLHSRFVAVAVDPRQKAASGCSIDKLFDRMRLIGEDLGADFLDAGRVYWRDDLDVIHGTTRAEFRQLASSSSIGADTPVFDLSISTVGELDRFEKRAGDSWHNQLLKASA